MRFLFREIYQRNTVGLGPKQGSAKPQAITIWLLSLFNYPVKKSNTLPRALLFDL